MPMARKDRSQELVEELARHFAPPVLRDLKMLAGVDPETPRPFLSSNLPNAPFDTLDALGAVSAAIETMNRQLEILVRVAASHAGPVKN